jgi:hypothetical protein
MDRQVPFWAWAGLFFLLGCNGTRTTSPSPAPVQISPPQPARVLPAAASASASAPVASASAPPPLPPVPPAPAPREATGAAAIVWQEDKASAGAFTSTLIEPGGTGYVEVASRKGRVFVGPEELFVLDSYKATSKFCDCMACNFDVDPPCGRFKSSTVSRSFLRSLKTGRPFDPWKSHTPVPSGCDTEDSSAAVNVSGGVGGVLFAGISVMHVSCHAAHPMFDEIVTILDLAARKETKLTPPPEVMEPLKARAKVELLSGGCVNTEEEPQFYGSSARYDARGVLHGVYDFTMGAPYVCGTGPGHYTVLSSQTSDWIPRELEPWGKLPGWVAAHLAKTGATQAFLISAGRLTAVKAEFKKR